MKRFQNWPTNLSENKQDHCQENWIDVRTAVLICWSVVWQCGGKCSCYFRDNMWMMLTNKEGIVSGDDVMSSRPPKSGISRRWTVLLIEVKCYARTNISKWMFNWSQSTLVDDEPHTLLNCSTRCRHFWWSPWFSSKHFFSAETSQTVTFASDVDCNITVIQHSRSFAVLSIWRYNQHETNCKNVSMLRLG